VVFSSPHGRMFGRGEFHTPKVVLNMTGILLLLNHFRGLARVQIKREELGSARVSGVLRKKLEAPKKL